MDSIETHRGVECPRHAVASQSAEAAPRIHEIYRNRDFRVHYFLCGCGPTDPVYEEAHDDACIAAVLSGFFSYRTERGTASLSPCSLLLGNKNQPYECGHEHSKGDTCLVFTLSEHLLNTIAESKHPGTRSPTFETAYLPPAPAQSIAIGRAQSAAESGDRLWLEEVAYVMAASALFHNSPESWERHSPGSADARRTADVIRYVEEHYSTPLTLGDLAEAAQTSPFHLIRVFRALTGTTPYRYVIQMRLREAAARLSSTDDPVTYVAFDAGFGDLSQFVRMFKRASGFSPGAFRSARPGRRTAA
jgi:AraC family transcriptional regulator